MKGRLQALLTICLASIIGSVIINVYVFRPFGFEDAGWTATWMITLLGFLTIVNYSALRMWTGKSGATKSRLGAILSIWLSASFAPLIIGMIGAMMYHIDFYNTGLVIMAWIFGLGAVFVLGYMMWRLWNLPPKAYRNEFLKKDYE